MVVRLYHTKPQPLACDREWVQRILPFLFHQSQSRAPDSVWKHLRKVWGVGRSFHQRFNQDWRLIIFFWRKNVVGTSRQTRLSSTVRLLMFKTKPQPCLDTREGHQPKFSRWQWQWWETVLRTFIDRLQTKRDTDTEKLVLRIICHECRTMNQSVWSLIIACHLSLLVIIFHQTLS